MFTKFSAAILMAAIAHAETTFLNDDACYPVGGECANNTSGCCDGLWCNLWSMHCEDPEEAVSADVSCSTADDCESYQFCNTGGVCENYCANGEEVCEHQAEAFIQ